MVVRGHKSFFSFTNHVVKKHVDLMDNDDTNPNEGAGQRMDGLGQENQELDFNDAPPESESFDLNREKDELSRSNATCLLQFKDKGRIIIIIDLYSGCQHH